MQTTTPCFTGSERDRGRDVHLDWMFFINPHNHLRVKPATRTSKTRAVSLLTAPLQSWSSPGEGVISILIFP